MARLTRDASQQLPERRRVHTREGQHELAAADQEWLSLAVNSLASSSARKGEGGAAAGAAAGCDGPAGLVLEVPLWSPMVAAAAAAGLPTRVRIIAQVAQNAQDVRGALELLRRARRARRACVGSRGAHYNSCVSYLTKMSGS